MFLISIIVPTFNRADFLQGLVSSLTNQSYQNWECLIIDDGSTDATEIVIKKIAKKEKRIRFLRRKESPKGISTCRNIGIRNSKGEYLMFLDSDDLLMPFCLERRINLMRLNPKLDFVVKNGIFRYEKENHATRITNIEKKEDDIARFIFADCVWHITGGFYKSKVITDNKILFDTCLNVHEDTDFHIRVLLLRGLRYKKFLTENPDYIIRRHGGDSVSQQSNPDFSVPAFRVSKKLLSDADQLSEYKKIILSRYYYDLQNLFFEKHFSIFLKEVYSLRASLKFKLTFFFLTLYTIAYIKFTGRRPEKFPSRTFKLIQSYHEYLRTIGYYEWKEKNFQNIKN